VIGCASAPPRPHLTIVAGRLARWPVSGGCEVVDWTAPSGRSTQVCLESASAIEIRRGDVRGFRIEDRRLGAKTWYVVSVLLEDESYVAILRELRGALPPAAHKTIPDPNEPDFFPGCDTPYAVLVDGKPSVVLPLRTMSRIRYADLVVGATRELPRAEAIAASWGLPVTRVIAAEIAAQPLQNVSLEDLIAKPSDWVGKRISVRGYLFGGRLFVSREQAEMLELPSRASIELAFDAGTADMCVGDYGSEYGSLTAFSASAFPACQSEWVQVEAFVDSTRGGSPELTRIERIAWNGTDCRRLPHRN